MVSMASLNRSAEIALVFSRSSISLRICRSRAAHPRVNEPAIVASIMAPRHRAATAAWTEQFSKCFVMAAPGIGLLRDRHYVFGSHHRVNWRARESGQPAGWPLLLLS